MLMMVPWFENKHKELHKIFGKNYQIITVAANKL